MQNQQSKFSFQRIMNLMKATHLSNGIHSILQLKCPLAWNRCIPTSPEVHLLWKIWCRKETTLIKISHTGVCTVCVWLYLAHTFPVHTLTQSPFHVHKVSFHCKGLVCVRVFMGLVCVRVFIIWLLPYWHYTWLPTFILQVMSQQDALHVILDCQRTCLHHSNHHIMLPHKHDTYSDHSSWHRRVSERSNYG